MTTPTRLTSNRAAEYLGISRALLYRLCADRRIGFERTSPGAPMRFRPADLDAYLESITVRAEEPALVKPLQAPAPVRRYVQAAGVPDFFPPRAAPSRPRRAGGNGGR